MSLGRSSPNLVGRLRAAPDISSRGSFLKVKVIEVKGQISVSQMSNLCSFSVCSPTSPRSLGRSSPNLVGRLRAVPDISSRGSFLKVKVIEVKGQISVSWQSLGRSSPNLDGRWRAAPDISSRGSFFKGQGHRGQRSNLCISAVLGPICMKLRECIQVDP